MITRLTAESRIRSSAFPDIGTGCIWLYSARSSGRGRLRCLHPAPTQRSGRWARSNLFREQTLGPRTCPRARRKNLVSVPAAPQRTFQETCLGECHPPARARPTMRSSIRSMLGVCMVVGAAGFHPTERRRSSFRAMAGAASEHGSTPGGSSSLSVLSLPSEPADGLGPMEVAFAVCRGLQVLHAMGVPTRRRV